jgi:hypothetical protein
MIKYSSICGYLRLLYVRFIGNADMVQRALFSDSCLQLSYVTKRVELGNVEFMERKHETWNLT